jgi:hypothetical protein
MFFHGPIANIKYAVISKIGASAGANKVLAYSQLSAAQFSLTGLQNHTIVPSANGIFTLG